MATSPNERRKRELIYEFERWGWDEKGWRPSTRNRYRRHVENADRWLVEHRGVSVMWATPEDLRAYLFAQTPTARNRNCIRSALIGFGDFLVASDWAEVNNARSLSRLPEPPLLPKPLEPEQARRLQQVALRSDDMAGILVFFLAMSGLRRSEILRLRRTHLELDPAHQDSWVRFAGKGGKERAVSLHPELSAKVARWIERTGPTDYIFPSPRYLTRPISETSLRHLVKEVGEAAGIKGLHPHKLRHTLATWLSDSGASLEEIQEILGHADPKTTRIYLKVRPTRVREAIRRLRVGGPRPQATT